MYFIVRTVLREQGEETTNLTGENKFDFGAAVKEGESGIFRGMDVYYMVMPTLFLSCCDL
jgi:hypothetical protein